MSATCVLWYVPHGNMSLSKHGNPVFPHFYPLNQNLARVRTMWVGGGNQVRTPMVTVPAVKVRSPNIPKDPGWRVRTRRRSETAVGSWKRMWSRVSLRWSRDGNR